MAKQTEFPFQVQGYELDSFQHVNNAVYLNYMEAARWKFFGGNRSPGLSVKRTDLIRWAIETTIRYLRELKMHDQCVIETSWSTDMDYIVAEHSLYSLTGTRRKAAKATVKMLLVSQERLIYSLSEPMKRRISGICGEECTENAIACCL